MVKAVSLAFGTKQSLNRHRNPCITLLVAIGLFGVLVIDSASASAKGFLNGDPWPEVWSWGQAWEEGPSEAAFATLVPTEIIVPMGTVIPKAKVAEQQTSRIANLAVVGEFESFEGALVAAYASNPKLMAQRANLRAADEGVVQALSGWRPRVTLFGQGSHGSYFDNLEDNQEEWRTPRNYGISFTQPLFQGGRTVAATNQAEAVVMAQRAQLDATEQSLLADAASAFLGVIRDEELLRLHADYVEVLNQELVAVNAMIKVGEATRTDVSQAEARLAQAVALLAEAQASVKRSHAKYVNVVGHSPGRLQRPTAPVPVPASFDEVKAAVQSGSAAIEVARWQAMAAQEGIALAEGELLPTVSLVARYSRDFHSTTSMSERETTEVLLTASVPLYSGGGDYSRVREQKQTYGERLLAMEDARRTSLEAASQDWNTLIVARGRLLAYQAQVQTNELALKGVREEMRAGSRAMLDVLNAQAELFRSRVDLEAARHDEFAAAIRLRATIGQASVADLALPVEVYDPASHYTQVRNKWFGVGIDEKYGEEGF